MLSKQYPMSPFTPFLCFFVQFLVLVRFAELGIPGDEYIAGFAFISNKIRFMKLNVCKGGYTSIQIQIIGKKRKKEVEEAKLLKRL